MSKGKQKCPTELRQDPLVLDNMETLLANEFFLREARKRFRKMRKAA